MRPLCCGLLRRGCRIANCLCRVLFGSLAEFDVTVNRLHSADQVNIESAVSECCFKQFFYRAMLCMRGTSHGPVSVCLCLSVFLSVKSRCSTKTAKHRITQTPHDSTGTLVFCCQRSPRHSTGITPCVGAKCRWDGSKSATFDKYPAISRKR